MDSHGATTEGPIWSFTTQDFSGLTWAKAYDSNIGVDKLLSIYPITGGYAVAGRSDSDGLFMKTDFYGNIITGSAKRLGGSSSRAG